MNDSATASKEVKSVRIRLALIVSAVSAVVIIVILIVTLRPPTDTVAGGAAQTPSVSASPSESASPSVSPTPSPPPEAGTPSAQPSPSEAAPIGETSDISAGLTAEITTVESIDGTADGPGEVAGPAVRFSVVITNSTGQTVSVGNTVINVDYGTERTPAAELLNNGRSPFPRDIAPNSTSTGTFVFTVPLDQRGNVRITVDYAVTVAPLIFQGVVPA